MWIRHRRSVAICRRFSTSVADTSTRPVGDRQQEAHAPDVLRASDLHARKNLRTDQIPRRTRAHSTCLRARHVRRPSQGRRPYTHVHWIRPSVHPSVFLSVSLCARTSHHAKCIFSWKCHTRENTVLARAMVSQFCNLFQSTQGTSTNISTVLEIGT